MVALLQKVLEHKANSASEVQIYSEAHAVRKERQLGGKAGTSDNLLRLHMTLRVPL